MTDYQHIPDIEMVSRLPSGYVDDLLTFDAAVKFFEDAPKRPAEMAGGRRNKKAEAESKTPG